MHDEHDWDLIHTYTRADALADGTLIAPPPDLCAEAGFRIPVALTRAVWADCVEWTDADTQHTGAPQDETGRLWDVLHMTTYAIRSMRLDGQTVPVQLYRVARDGNGGATLVDLIAHCGPGDEGEPVITIMQPDED